MDVDPHKILELIKALVLNGDYHYSNKVRLAIGAGDFSHEDIECCIATATNIHKAEPDDLKEATDAMKYTILGRDQNGSRFYTCGKIKPGSLSRVYFFITAHAAD